jgi:hypothetical protein
MSPRRLTLRDLDLFDPVQFRAPLTSLYALMVAGSAAEARETELLRLGVSRAQAESIAYDVGLVLPPSARRAELRAAFELIGQRLAHIAGELRDLHPLHYDLFEPLHELSRVPTPRLVSLVQAIAADTADCDAENGADRFLAFCAQFSDRSGPSNHVSEAVGHLTVQVLGCDGDEQIFCAADAVTTSIALLQQTGGEGVLHVQSRSEAARREAALFGLLSNRRDVAVLGGEPLLSPAMEGDGRLRTYDALCLESELGRKLSKRDVERLENDRLARFPLGRGLHRTASDLALAQHAVAAMRPGGRATLLAPAGVLFRGGLEGELRKALLKADWVEAIIALPSGALEGTAIESVLLKLVRDKAPERRGQVLFASVPASDTGKEELLSLERIERIVQCIASWSDEPRLARVVDIDELEAADFTLQPSRFIDDFVPPPPVDWERERRHLAVLEDSTRAWADDITELLDNPPV